MHFRKLSWIWLTLGSASAQKYADLAGGREVVNWKVKHGLLLDIAE